jgi:phosphotriesterase-related protein
LAENWNSDSTVRYGDADLPGVSVKAGRNMTTTTAASVPTARGAVDVASLGRTLMHEHVFIVQGEMVANTPSMWDEAAGIRTATEKLTRLKEAGIDTIVDLTVLGLGQNVPLVKKVADQVEINIIVGTGYYTYDGLPTYFFGRKLDEHGTLAPSMEPPAEGPDPMVEYFVGDIENGIGDTGVRASLLKCATDAFGVTPGVERVLRAVARAHLRTGVPITTHTHAAARNGLDQQRVFQEEGVDLTRVIIGHSGDSTDIAYLEALIDAGSYLGMDRFGFESRGSFEDRVRIVAEMCALGHADRMVLSHDACGVRCLPDHMIKGFNIEAHQQPKWNWMHLLEDVLPALRDKGVSHEQVEQMLVHNPRLIFSVQGGYDAMRGS